MIVGGLAQVGEVCGLPGFDTVQWDPREAASDYAMFAALLAGFAISGLLWLASLDKEKTPARIDALAILFAAVVPLALGTLIFAEISGTTDCERANREIITGTALLTIGAVSLMIGVGSVLIGYFNETINEVVVWVAASTIAVATVGIYFGNQTALTLADGANWSRSIESLLQVAAIAFSIGVAYVLRVREKFSQARTVAGSTVAVGTISYLLLVFANPYESHLITHAVAWIRIIIWAAVLPVYAAMVTSFRQAEVRAGAQE